MYLRYTIFLPPRLKIGGILFLSCLSFYHSVILSIYNSVWNFSLANEFSTMSTRALIFHMITWVIFVTRHSHGYQHFWPCDLDLGVWPTFWKLNLAYNFWTVSARALIFNMIIFCDKTFLRVSTSLTLWPWPWLTFWKL